MKHRSLKEMEYQIMSNRATAPLIKRTEKLFFYIKKKRLVYGFLENDAQSQAKFMISIMPNIQKGKCQKKSLAKSMDNILKGIEKLSFRKYGAQKP